MKEINKYIYWIPRILSMVFILFLVLFSLDVFEMGLGFWGTLLGLFMHNIPALILIAVLIVSWKYEIVGGVAFILAGFVYIGLLLTSSSFEWYMVSWSILIAGPAFLIGALFLVNWKNKRSRTAKG